ncbi:hypothetical protein SCP_0412360 [Sparassis crispa]|uniref:Uncharacterized protein n=1 Tax=Sparassis crispa TaxID=139825 RepID=A0A401GL30_9APHY|nr:hypothetical protein SCP_0412360 [Sparassis crispa]GBE82849.1 hypothetical protein SCP_0412360 [Sparassis crispa]
MARTILLATLRTKELASSAMGFYIVQALAPGKPVAPRAGQTGRWTSSLLGQLVAVS